MGYWIDYIKHTMQCIEGTKGVDYWIDYIKHTIQCIEGTKEGGLIVLDKLHKTYNTMHRGTERKCFVFFLFMVLNATFNNISDISTHELLALQQSI